LVTLNIKGKFAVCFPSREVCELEQDDCSLLVIDGDDVPSTNARFSYQQERDKVMNKPNGSIPAVSPVAQEGAHRRRARRPLPPIDVREWLTPDETATALGCSVATVHRLRRGLIAGVAVLPAVAVGTRKYIFRKASVAHWQDQNEKA
jgi:hypothetical protein